MIINASIFTDDELAIRESLGMNILRDGYPNRCPPDALQKIISSAILGAPLQSFVWMRSGI